MLVACPGRHFVPALLSFIVPVLNEEGSLRQLHQEIAQTAKQAGWRWELYLIDDGSTDRSWQVIAELAQADAQVHGIRFRRNFGKAAALAAGFAAAQGDFLVTLDGDLQDDPGEVPGMLQDLQDRALDLMSGWKRQRHDPWHKVIPSRIFNGLVSFLTGVRLHDHNCGLKLYRREVGREIRLYGERHRFIPVLAAARGFKVGERVVRHRPRRHGRSKYGMGRFIKGFLDLVTVRFLTSYSHRPQHLLGIAGLLFAFAGLLGMGILAVDWLLHTGQPGHIPLHQRPLLIYSVASLILGVQLFSMGLIAELITSQNRRGDEVYCIAEQTPPTGPSTP
jgi:glycosyltransferase involved in cell wall biosynthesis